MGDEKVCWHCVVLCKVCWWAEGSFLNLLKPVSISGCLGLRIGSLLFFFSSHLASRMSCFRPVSQFVLFLLRRALAEVFQTAICRLQEGHGR